MTTAKVTKSFSLQPDVVEAFTRLAEELDESHSALLDLWLVHILNAFERAKYLENPKEFEEARQEMKSTFTSSKVGASYNLVLKLDVMQTRE